MVCRITTALAAALGLLCVPSPSLGHIGCPPDCSNDGGDKWQPGQGVGGKDLKKEKVKVGKNELTMKNWEKKTKGREIFIMFFAPWCEHCQGLKPDWDKLIAKFKGSETTGIFVVDCTGTGSELCEELDVDAYPTLKFGSSSNKGAQLQDYKGPRDLAMLTRFAEEALVDCTPKDTSRCDETELKQIAEYASIPLRFLTAEVEKLEKGFAEKEADLDKRLKDADGAEAKEKLKVEATALEVERKTSGLRLMRFTVALKHREEELANKKKGRAVIRELLCLWISSESSHWRSHLLPLASCACVARMLGCTSNRIADG